MIPDLEQVSADMNIAAGKPFVVALEAVVTTSTGRVAFVARHSDGRHLAMMCDYKQSTHDQMVAMAQAAFDQQHQGHVPQ